MFLKRILYNFAPNFVSLIRLTPVLRTYFKFKCFFFRYVTTFLCTCKINRHWQRDLRELTLVFTVSSYASEWPSAYTWLGQHLLINTYSMNQPDLYYFDATKTTSWAQSNFVWRIRVASEYSLWTWTRLVTSFLWLQNSIDQAVS